MYEATAIILAGGRGSRMNGIDKAQIVLDGRTLIDRIVEQLQQWFAEVLIVSDGMRHYDFKNVKVVADYQQGCGPLMGIYSGLAASSHEINFVMACDMPYVSASLIELMMSEVRDNDVVVPIVGGHPEPLAALYCKRVTGIIKAYLQAHQLKVIVFYKDVKVCYIDEERILTVDPDLRSFCDINSPNDIDNLRRQSTTANKP